MQLAQNAQSINISICTSPLPLWWLTVLILVLLSCSWQEIASL